MACFKLLSLSLYTSLLAIPAYFQFVFSTFNLFSVEIWVSDGCMANNKQLPSFSLAWNCLLWMWREDQRCKWSVTTGCWWYHHSWTPVATGIHSIIRRIGIWSHDENPKHATTLTQRFPKKKQACTFRWHRDYYLNGTELLCHKREGETQPPPAKSIRRLIQHLSRHFVKYLPPCWGGLNPLKNNNKKKWTGYIMCIQSVYLFVFGHTYCIFKKVFED